MQENERLRLAMICKKCKITNVETLFLPCRHLASCENGANNMENCFLQCEDTRNCSSLCHVSLAYTRRSRLAYGW